METKTKMTAHQLKRMADKYERIAQQLAAIDIPKIAGESAYLSSRAFEATTALRHVARELRALSL